MLKKLAVLSFTAGLMSAAFAGGSDILINPAFENVQNGRPVGWALTGRFRAERDGHNGSGGLVWDSTVSDGKTHRAIQKLNGVHPGDTVNITALVKKDGFDPHGVEVGTPATMDGEVKVNFYLDSIGVSLVRLAPRN